VVTGKPLIRTSRAFDWVDLAVVGLLAAFIYALVTVAREWTGPLRPIPEIHLEARYLPLYALFSLLAPGRARGARATSDCRGRPGRFRGRVPKELSGRMKQRVGLARANAKLRNLFVFDLIVQAFKHSSRGEVDEAVILSQLALHFPRERPQRILRTIVAWARYAELFKYSSLRKVLHGLQPPAPAAPPAP
jgi:hypothetical protein